MAKKLIHNFLQRANVYSIVNFLWDDVILNLPGIPQPKGRVTKDLKKNDSTLLITICASNWRGIRKWGDFYFAAMLGDAFQRHGFKYQIAVRNQWQDIPKNYDIHIHLRGLRKFDAPKKAKISAVWYISHPNLVATNEYEKFDIIFSASSRFTNKIKRETKKPVFFLPQATDPKIFFYKHNARFVTPIAFVGNTRGVFREVIKFTLNADFGLRIWGKGWEDFANKRYLSNQKISLDKELRDIYSSAHIVLNDHWSDMKKWGFVNNRIFDVLACGGFIISDFTPGIRELFGQIVVCYQSRNDLVAKLNYYLKNPKKRRMIAEKGRQFVLRKHTFNHRAEFILAKLKELGLIL